NFTTVASRRGAALGFDNAGVMYPDTPMVAGVVYAIAPDGQGGYFIGGEFRAVGGLPRNFAAHILPDLGLDPAWDANLNSNVYAIAVSGGVVYLGGGFTSVNGATNRNRAAAVDAVTGVATAWNPNLNGVVDAIDVAGSTVYLG